MAIKAKEQEEMQRAAAQQTLAAEQPNPSKPLDVNSAPMEEQPGGEQTGPPGGPIPV